jgi:hypothetical protein
MATNMATLSTPAATSPTAQISNLVNTPPQVVEDEAGPLLDLGGGVGLVAIDIAM